MVFADRRDAGEQLARRLGRYQNSPDTVVLALPRGGVEVAEAVAQRLGAPLDVFVVRSLGLLGDEKIRLGAVASGGVRILNETLIRRFCVSTSLVDFMVARETDEVARRELVYRGDTRLADLAGKVVIIVDDGSSTTATLTLSLRSVRALHSARIVLALPVASDGTLATLSAEADEVVRCAASDGRRLDDCFAEFDLTTDDEVRTILTRAAARQRFVRAYLEPHIENGIPFLTSIGDSTDGRSAP